MEPFDAGHTGKYCIGIDLGTTNTTVAISRLDLSGRIILDNVSVYQAGSGKASEILPSILFVDKNGKVFVGQRAQKEKNKYIASGGEAQRYIENAKRHIGSSEPICRIDGKDYTAIEVAKQILSCIRQDGEIKKCIDIADVFITVPANFETDQINNTLEAARQAGFEKACLRSEPKAAILSFLHDDRSRAELSELKQLNLLEKKRILVIDIGGGTCDICVEDVSETESHEYTFRHIGVGRENIGGMDFDRRIALFLMKKYNLDPDKLSDMDVAVLKALGQEFKETFSYRISEVIHDEDEYDGEAETAFEDPRWLELVDAAEPVELARKIGGEHQFFEMTGHEFYEAISPLIYEDADRKIANRDDYEDAKNMQSLIQGTLDKNKIDPASIDVIFLTGGMSLCFVLKAALYEVFRKKIICPSDPLKAVSRGAALMNKYKTSSLTDSDLMPRSIMIETGHGILTKLIAAGEKVPASGTVEHTFRTASRNGVQINLFEGEDEFDNQLKRLHSIHNITFGSLKELGQRFQIQYEINNTRQIKFTFLFSDGSVEVIDTQSSTSGVHGYD